MDKDITAAHITQCLLPNTRWSLILEPAICASYADSRWAIRSTPESSVAGISDTCPDISQDGSET